MKVQRKDLIGFGDFHALFSILSWSTSNRNIPQNAKVT